MPLASITVSLNWSSEEILPRPHTYTLKCITLTLTRTYHCTEFKVVFHQFKVKTKFKRKMLKNSYEHTEELDRTHFSGQQHIFK